MKPALTLAETTTPDGVPLSLVEHDGEYSLHSDGVQLESSFAHNGATELGQLAAQPFRGARNLASSFPVWAWVTPWLPFGVPFYRKRLFFRSQNRFPAFPPGTASTWLPSTRANLMTPAWSSAERDWQTPCTRRGRSFRPCFSTQTHVFPRLE